MKDVKKKQKNWGIRLVMLLVLAFVWIVVFSELVTFTVYAIPLFSTFIAKVNGITTESNWLYAGIMWGLPSGFMILLFTAFHIWFVRKISHWSYKIICKYVK